MMRKEVTDAEERIMKKHQKLQKVKKYCWHTNANHTGSCDVVSLQQLLSYKSAIDPYPP